jgi:tankyrase
MNPIEHAAFELRLDDLKELVRAGGDLHGALLSASSAHDAEARLQVRVIRYLLQRGAYVNETDKNGVTPLHRAVRFRSPAAVKELIAQGADVNAVDKKSRSTPLHRAVTNTGAPATAGKADRAVEIARLLLAAGANPRVKNKSGKTPSDYAKNPQLQDALSSRRPGKRQS